MWETVSSNMLSDAVMDCLGKSWKQRSATISVVQGRVRSRVMRDGLRRSAAHRRKTEQPAAPCRYGVGSWYANGIRQTDAIPCLPTLSMFRLSACLHLSPSPKAGVTGV